MDSWYGTAAHELSAGDLSVVVLPRHGGKVASLRLGDREWLAAPAGPLSAPTYGGVFTDADMSGWDEMLPTVDACTLPSGVAVPDHGEVWALPWRVTSAGPDKLVCEVDGRALPYTCRRTMTVTAGTVHCDYEIAVTGSEPVPLLWAAHPQFTLRAGTALRLPADVDEVWNLYPTGTRERLPAGDVPALFGVAPGGARKWYVPPRVRVDRCELVDADGSWLRLRWDPELVPYLGVWVDHGMFSREPVIALEPTTGYYDSLARAALNECVPVVRPGVPLSFDLTIEVGRS